MKVDRALLHAASCERKGEIEAATQLYQNILSAFPSNKRAKKAIIRLQNLRRATDPAAPPPHVMQKISKLYNGGNHAELYEYLGTLAPSYPQSYDIWNVMGACCTHLQNPAAAAEAFQRACEINPYAPEAHSNLGTALRRQSRLDQAIACYCKAIELKPDYAQAYLNLGNAFREQGSIDRAAGSYSMAIEINAALAEAYNNLASILKDQEKLAEAETLFRKATEIDPAYVDAYLNLGNTLLELDKPKEASDSFKTALNLNPQLDRAYSGYGTALSNLGDQDGAIAAQQKAIEINPRNASAHTNLSANLKFKGKLDDALASANRALELKPDNIDCLLAVSALVSLDPAHALTNHMLGLHGDPKTRIQDRDRLSFALARIFEKATDAERAFAFYEEGNRGRKAALGYDIQQDRNLFAKTKELSLTLKADGRIASERSPITPIFIIGMPRSGTSLVEQILTCHSDIHGAGELDYLSQFNHFIRDQKFRDYAEELGNLRQQYLEKIADVAGGANFVTDKMPHNFMSLNHICAAFPEARIIRVKRDPKAICWANFRQNFIQAKSLAYSYDLSDVVAFYKLFEDLMAHWEELYPNRIFTLDYDRLTVDQETLTRALLDHLGADWQKACLSPEKNQRAVKTASVLQVRKPVYAGSSQKWKMYEPYLNGAFDTL